MSDYKKLKVVLTQLINKNIGFSLVEAILAVSIFALIVTALVGGYLYGVEGTAQSGIRARAVFLAEEGIEAVRSIKQNAYNELQFSQSGIVNVSNRWELLGEGTSETIGIFSRTIVFNDVCRDVSDLIVTCPGLYTDVFTKEVVVTVSWNAGSTITRYVKRSDYITDWGASGWSQTNWIGGSGQTIWSDQTRYASDNGSIDVNTAGAVSLKSIASGPCRKEWPFIISGNYSYDSGKIEIISGVAQLVESSSGAGQITDSIIDSFDFDTSTGYFPSMLHVSGDVYAVSYTGSGNDGFIITFTIDSFGQIGNSVIDSLEFDTSNGRETSLVHVSGDIYAVAYRGSGSDGFISTLTIQTNGQISNSVIDSLEFDTSNGYEPVLRNVDGDVYAVAYRGSGNDGFLKTFTISSNGQIGNSTIDELEFEPNDCYRPDMIRLDTDTIGVSYTGPSSDGFLVTADIASNGDISNSLTDTLEFDSQDGYTTNIELIAGNVYGIAYSSVASNGVMGTVDIQSDGQIGAGFIDSYTFEPSYAYDFGWAHASSDVYAISYRGPSDDGFVTTLHIADNGSITHSTIDTLEFNTSDGFETMLLQVTPGVYAIAYRGDGADGYTVTIGITGSSYPTDSPSINPNSSFTPSSVSFWSAFTETASKDGGEIYYQLSDDNGATWYYWDGVGWAAAGSSDYSTATEINANITTFPISAGQILFKAFLESDGSQFVQLDEITIDCIAGGGGTVYTDDEQSDFDVGTYNQTQWDNGNLWVELTAAGQSSGSGDFTSRIIDAGSAVPWTAISWIPQLPIYKELPSAGQSESGYSVGNANMTDNVVLLHMNESAGMLADSSGNGNAGSSNGGVSYGVQGKLNTAISLDGNNDYVSISDSSTLDITGDISIEMWIYVRDDNNYPDVLTKGNYTESYSVWLENNGQIIFAMDNDRLSSTTTLANNTWYHLALVRNGSTRVIYIDGQPSGSDFYGASMSTNNDPLYISSSSYPLDGIVDEVVLYDRGLSPAEVVYHYQRGALQLRYQVRSCDDPLCAGESFIGPDGTAGTYYSELANTSTGLPSLPLTNIIDNQYYQYKALFSTDDNSYTPELKSVSVSTSGGGGGGDYETYGVVTSSAYNMTENSSVEIISWDEMIPACSPVCSVSVELATAPDSGGSPGSWSAWTAVSNNALIPTSLNGNQWVRYRAILEGDGSQTPVLQEIRLYYN